MLLPPAMSEARASLVSEEVAAAEESEEIGLNEEKSEGRSRLAAGTSIWPD